MRNATTKVGNRFMRTPHKYLHNNLSSNSSFSLPFVMVHPTEFTSNQAEPSVHSKQFAQFGSLVFTVVLNTCSVALTHLHSFNSMIHSLKLILHSTMTFPIWIEMEIENVLTLKLKCAICECHCCLEQKIVYSINKQQSQ